MDKICKTCGSNDPAETMGHMLDLKEYEHCSDNFHKRGRKDSTGKFSNE